MEVLLKPSVLYLVIKVPIHPENVAMVQVRLDLNLSPNLLSDLFSLELGLEHDLDDERELKFMSM